MERYLIHHDLFGTWDLVVRCADWTVEHTCSAGVRKVFSILEFEESEDGIRMAEGLASAMARAVLG